MESSQATTLQQHPTYYFPLADLVIQSAPDECGVCVLFRVSKSVLAFNSSVFAGMFTLPDAPGTQEMYDGAPIVRVTDTAEDLHALLSVLHDPSILSFPRFDPDIPGKLTGVMALAIKYNIDTVRSRVIDIMHESWPQTFEQWLRFRSEITVIRASHSNKKDGLVDGKSFEERIPEPASALRFARDFNIPTIIPFAVYTLAGIPLSHDWNGYRRQLQSSQPLESESLSRRARWDLLDISDYRRVIACRERLANSVGEILFRFARMGQLMDWTICGSCGEGCTGKLENILEVWQDPDGGILSGEAIGFATGVPDPLGLLEELHNSRPDWPTCKPCQECMQGCMKDMQEDFWRRIVV